MGIRMKCSMGNAGRKSKCSPGDNRLEVFKYSKLDGFSLDELPKELVLPVLMRFDSSRVHTSVPWHKRLYHKIGTHFELWRPRVIVLFSTELVVAGKGHALGCVLTLKVYTPKKNSKTPLGPAECKKMHLNEQFMFYTADHGDDDINKPVLQRLYKRLKDIITTMCLLRVIFNVENYPLFPSAMECIAKAFAHKRAFMPHIGIQCTTNRLDGMGDFLCSIPTRYFELSPVTITQEDKIFKQANIVINRNSEEHPERMRDHVHDIIAEWRQGVREINVYKVCNFRPEVLDLIKRDWISILCSCSREMVVYGPELRALRVGVMGPDLIIRSIPFE